jgi:hypothetical protein
MVGTVVVAGTGAVAQGRDAEGTVHRTGGWGYLAGDEGGGYDLGVRALRAVYRSLDGRGPETRLTPLLLGHYGASDLHHMRELIYRSSTTRAHIAASATAVAEAAAAGDDIGIALLRDAALALADFVNGVLDTLGSSAARSVAVVGGVASSGPPLLEPFAEAVRARHPGARLTPPRFDAVRGALILALRELDPPISRGRHSCARSPAMPRRRPPPEPQARTSRAAPPNGRERGIARRLQRAFASPVAAPAPAAPRARSTHRAHEPQLGATATRGRTPRSKPQSRPSSGSTIRMM